MPKRAKVENSQSVEQIKHPAENTGGPVRFSPDKGIEGEDQDTSRSTQGYDGTGGTLSAGH